VAEIALRGVRKVFGSGRDAVVALEDCGFTVPQGEFVTLLGPSGCGKTTALDLIAGFTRPSVGSVSVGGRSVAQPGPDRAVVFQDAALFPWLRVEDNVAFGLRIARRPAPEIRERVGGLLERVGLTAFRRRYPAELSGGMRQRVALARVLALESDVLLMDEPFGALDAQTRGLMQEFLTGIWERDRRTVLFVTHDLDEAVFLADRVLVMTARPGRIKRELTVDLPRPRAPDIMAAPRFHALRDEIRSLVRDEAIKTMRPLAAGREAS
jgi:ABC-type nitrate/sulfonate/bicarbonate transport system ATPase subunit